MCERKTRLLKFGKEPVLTTLWFELPIEFSAFVLICALGRRGTHGKVLQEPVTETAAQPNIH